MSKFIRRYTQERFSELGSAQPAPVKYAGQIYRDGAAGTLLSSIALLVELDNKQIISDIG